MNQAQRFIEVVSSRSALATRDTGPKTNDIIWAVFSPKKGSLFQACMFFGKIPFLVSTSLVSCSVLGRGKPSGPKDPQWPITWLCAKEAHFQAVASPWPAEESLPLVCRDGIPSLVTPKRCHVLLQRGLNIHTFHGSVHNSKETEPSRCPSMDRWIIKMWDMYVCITHFIYVHIYNGILSNYLKKVKFAGKQNWKTLF